jgi:hypothetical protein
MDNTSSTAPSMTMLMLDSELNRRLQQDTDSTRLLAEAMCTGQFITNAENIIIAQAEHTRSKTELAAVCAKSTALETRLVAAKAESVASQLRITAIQAKQTAAETELIAIKAKQTAAKAEIMASKFRGEAIQADLNLMRVERAVTEAEFTAIRADRNVLKADRASEKATRAADEAEILSAKARHAVIVLRRMIRERKITMISGSSETCEICMDKTCVVRLPCNHKLCQCAITWFAEQYPSAATCPKCRREC